MFLSGSPEIFPGWLQTSRAWEGTGGPRPPFGVAGKLWEVGSFYNGPTRACVTALPDHRQLVTETCTFLVRLRDRPVTGTIQRVQSCNGQSCHSPPPSPGRVESWGGDRRAAE